MKYNEDFLIKLKKSAEALSKQLQEYRYSGSYETKLDLGYVIKIITNQTFIIDNLQHEIKRLESLVSGLQPPKPEIPKQTDLDLV